MSAAWCGRRSWSSSCTRSKAGEPYDQAAYEACLKDSIDEVVRQQVEAGIDIVSDGEFSKGRNWAFYVHDRLSGVATRAAHRRKRPKDPAGVRPAAARTARPSRNSTPNTIASPAWASGSATASSSTARSPIRTTQVKRDIANLKAAAAKAKASGAFLPVVAPASALPGAKNEHYADEKSLLFALADCLHQEYKAIVDAGLYVQIDDAFLPYMYEKMVPPMTLGAVSRTGRSCASTRSTTRSRGIPQERSRYHICWGSWNGPHAFDVPMKDIVDLHAAGECRRLSVRGRQSAPRARMGGVGERQAAARQDADPGRASATPPTSSSIPNWWRSGSCGSPRLVGRENVMAGTDCGFAQSPFAQARASEHHVGEAQIARRRRADRNQRTLGPPFGGVARADNYCPNSDAGSTFTPGPMVEEIATRLMKVPLAPAGFAFCTASAKALMFCTSLSAGNDALPTPACTMPAFSTRNSTEPPLAPLHRGGDVHGHGADLRVRHHAARAQHLAEPADQRHQVGRGDAAVEVDVAALHLLDQVLGADHVGAGGLGLVGLGAAREHRHAHAAARTVRQVDDAAHHLVGVARIDAEIHRDLDGLVELGLGPLLDHLHRLLERIELVAVDALADGVRCVFRDCSWPLLPDLDAHRAGGAFHHAHGGLDGVAVQILHLLLGDLADLRLGHACRPCRGPGSSSRFRASPPS